jgi:hypothetical protein
MKTLHRSSAHLIGVAVTVLWRFGVSHAAEFLCQSGDANCLIAAINDANELKENSVITLGPGTYSLGGIVEEITSSITITSSGTESPPIIEDTVTVVGMSGKLIMRGIIFRGSPGGGGGLSNSGTTLLEDSVVEHFHHSPGPETTLVNFQGVLTLNRTVVTDSSSAHTAGAIFNNGGTVIVENSTLTHNGADGAGAIANAKGTVVVRDSSITSNATGLGTGAGGGIANFDNLEIVNSTIAENAVFADLPRGGGIFNSGFASITNSTIRGNRLAGEFAQTAEGF